MKKRLLVIVSVLLFVNTWVQSQVLHKSVKYTVDNQLVNQVKKNNPNNSGILKKSMKLNSYTNGRVFYVQYDGPEDCYTKTIFSNDSILITGHMEGELGYGFMLFLFGDSCKAAAFALSDSAIYKYQISDTVLVDFITPQSLTQKVALSKRPLYKEGEVITGLVEIESKEFYYYVKKPTTRFTIKLKAYFQTAPLKKQGRFDW
jgi:hypothetical protein